jgi:rare lipoprotein A
VENLDNGREITVRVNDRGPFARNRIIDLSYAAAAKLGMLENGTAPVEIRTVQASKSDREEIESTSLPAQAPPVDQVEVTTEGTATPVGKPSGDAGGDSDVDYYVQIGAFGERDNAYRMVGRAETARLETPIEVNQHRRGEAVLYRVQVGPLTDAAAVDRVTDALREAGIRQSHVVVKTADENTTAESI